MHRTPRLSYVGESLGDLLHLQFEHRRCNPLRSKFAALRTSLK